MKITLALIDKDNQIIHIPNWDAESCGVPGLAICKAYAQDENKNPTPFERSPMRFWWQIIHVESGIAVIEMILYKSEAQNLASQLTGLDWNIPAKNIEANLEYGKLVRRVAAMYYDKCMEKQPQTV